jgi:UDP-N-acetylmuramoyl-tripeptide--D-alanyl-D-alanine ligase
MMISGVIDAIYGHFVASQYQICTDSRALKSGDVFFCIRGEKFDGNAFAEEALKLGALAVIVDHETFQNDPRFIWVEDTTLAIQQLAKKHAKEMPATKIMVGGSNGKTTTKEVTRTILEGVAATLATPGNWNNHIGVPLTLLSLRPEHRYAVVEMGTNHPGEMGVLCDLIHTDIGLITNIGKEHLEGFGSIEAIAKEESEVFASVIKHNALAIVNLDDPWLASMSKRLSKTITLSLENPAANLYAGVTQEMPELAFEFFVNGISQGQYTSPLSGKYNAYNLLFGAAVAQTIGMEPRQAMDLACTYKPTNNRSEWKTIGTTQLFLDAYNANPSSMSAAIQSFATISGSKSFFLGDMLELGEHAHDEHKAIFNLCRELNLQESTYLVGPEFCAACPEHPYRFETMESLLAWLDTHPIDTKYAFIKGSRGIKMERVQEHFMQA